MSTDEQHTDVTTVDPADEVTEVAEATEVPEGDLTGTPSVSEPGSDDDGCLAADDADDADDADERRRRGRRRRDAVTATTPPVPPRRRSGAGSAELTARLEREGEIAADFLERLLDIADLDGDLDVDVEGERAAVAIVDSSEGRVPRRLVGPNGEVLDALQELTRLAVQARTGDRTRLMLDVAGHRARRREQLVVRAKEAIDEVQKSGEPLRLEAMNPFERKIVHDEVAAAGLQSSSEGAEPDRRIVIRPAD